MNIEVGKCYRANITISWCITLPVGYRVVVVAVSARKISYDWAGDIIKVSRKEFERGFSEEPDATTLKQYFEVTRIIRSTPLSYHKAMALSPEQRREIFDAIKATEDTKDALNKLLLSLATGGQNERS
jgi:ABC-type phosphate/phosphonate transport system substrate-binding protein